jgi:hypothetical protein
VPDTIEVATVDNKSCETRTKAPKNSLKAKAILKINVKSRAKTKAIEAPPRPDSTFQYWWEEKPIIKCSCCWCCDIFPITITNDGKSKRFAENTRCHKYDLYGELIA